MFSFRCTEVSYLLFSNSSFMHLHAITNLCTMKRKHLRCVSSHCMHMHAIPTLCSEQKTPKVCFIALHDISNLFLVMHMHAITKLCAVKRKHLRSVSVHCMTYLTCVQFSFHCTEVSYCVHMRNEK